VSDESDSTDLEFSFLMYAVVLMEVEPTPLGIMDCLVFGALISATDTGNTAKRNSLLH